MKILRLLPLILVAFFLAGCGTITQQDRAVLRAHDVPPDVFDKMLYGDPLSLSDVIVLSERGVPPGLIIHYMDEIDTVYVLGKSDVKHLRAAGVNEQVISYMLSTAPGYGEGGPGGPPPPPYGYAGPYSYGAYPDGYYGGLYGGPVVFVGGYGRWGHRGWGHGGRGGRGGWHHDH